MGRVLLLLASIATLAIADPLLLALNRFSSATDALVNGVEMGSRLYLASSDDNSILRKINITTGVMSMTLDKLNDYNDDGTPKSILLSGDLWIATSNDDAVMASMTGKIYVTTRAQTNDPNFSVYVIKDQHIISTNAMKSTVVILNTYSSDSADQDAPRRPSYVSGMDQSPNTNIYFQWGIPPSNWYEVTNNTFFRNPVALVNGTWREQVFFDNVEPLQIDLDAWYFQVMGPNNVKIEKKYVSNHNYTVTATKTTGLIMTNGNYQAHVVNFMPDTTKVGDSGIYYAAYGEYGTIGVYLETETGGVSSTETNATNSKDQWSFYVNDQAYKLTVNTTSNTPGTFFAQYFTFPGLDKPVITTLPTEAPQTTPSVTEGASVSTTTVRTSTKGSGYVYGLEMILMTLVGVRLL